MSKLKKILIAVGAVVVVAAVVVGILFAVFHAKKAPVAAVDPAAAQSVYVVGQPPYADSYVFDTALGMNSYWSENRSGDNGIELVLQQSKDGKLVMLSEALPAKSNADDLYGADVQVGDLTLEELLQINLCYDFVDADGFQSYVGVTGEQLAHVRVVPLDEMLEFFGHPGRIVHMYVRFYDETAIADLGEALKTVYDAAAAKLIDDRVVFLPQSDEAAKAADTACPDLARAATTAEAKALYRDSKHGKAQQSLPYTVVYEEINGQFGSEAFLRYAREQGVDVVLSGVEADDALRCRNSGVTAIASSDPQPIIEILKNATKEERESRKAADSSAQQ